MGGFRDNPNPQKKIARSLPPSPLCSPPRLVFLASSLLSFALCLLSQKSPCPRSTAMTFIWALGNTIPGRHQTLCLAWSSTRRSLTAVLILILPLAILIITLLPQLLLSAVLGAMLAPSQILTLLACAHTSQSLLLPQPSQMLTLLDSKPQKWNSFVKKMPRSSCRSSASGDTWRPFRT